MLFRALALCASVWVFGCGDDKPPAPPPPMDAGPGDAGQSDAAVDGSLPDADTDAGVPDAGPVGRTWAWDRVWGGPGLENAKAVATDDAGNIYITGAYDMAVDFGGGVRGAMREAVFVVALARDGSWLWDYSFGDLDARSEDIAVGVGGGVYVVGRFEGMVDFGGGERTGGAGGTDTHAFVLKLTSAGAYEWDRTFPATRADGCAGHPGDGVTVTGSFSRTVDFGGGPRMPTGRSENGYVVRLAPMGEWVSDAQFGQPGAVRPTSVAVADDATTYVGGAFVGPTDFGGGERTYAGGLLDAFVLALNGAGAHAWDRTWGSAAAEQVDRVRVGPDTGLTVGGVFEGPLRFGSALRTPVAQDLFVVRLDDAGATQWDLRITGGTGTEARALAVDDGSVWAGGGWNAGTSYAGVLVHAGPGGLERERFTVDAFIRGVALGAERDVFYVGQLRDLVDFGGGGLTPTGPQDAFVVKLD